MEYDLNRFIKAQNEYYDIALTEIKNGKKESHWIWYVFPQIEGLGKSFKSKYYGIKGIEEAKEYYKNEELKYHLLEISNALLKINDDIVNIVGHIDALKICSCMTLFNNVDPNNKVFKNVIDKFYNGNFDIQTLKIIKCK